MWQQRLGTSSEFCQAVVSNGYLTEKQMQRAMERYRLGASRDGGVIFWQIDECDQLRDGKIMHYCPDCHRDHDRKPTWAAYLLRKHGQLPKEWNTDHCLFGLHLLKTLPCPSLYGGEQLPQQVKIPAQRLFVSLPHREGPGVGLLLPLPWWKLRKLR